MIEGVAFGIMASPILVFIFYGVKGLLKRKKKSERYCVECKHFESYGGSGPFGPVSLCRADLKYDLIWKEPESKFCSCERGKEGPCGPEGKLFELKGE